MNMKELRGEFVVAKLKVQALILERDSNSTAKQLKTLLDASCLNEPTYL